ncbi:MAG: hypothetical protein PUG10_06055 [Lachnospiraceae bacterium]|nr:hypothetical protein [Lachnospiraceae bacterium]
MDNNMYRLFYNGGLMVAIFFLVLSIFLFFWLNIPKVISELVGMRFVRKDKKKNEKKVSYSEKEKEKYYSRQSERIKVKQSSSNAFVDKSKKDKTPGPLKKKHTGDLIGETDTNLTFGETDSVVNNNVNVDFAVEETEPETGLLVSGKLGEVIVGNEEKEPNLKFALDNEKETSVLSSEQETSVLSEEQETSVLSEEQETSVLSEEQETSVLSDNVDGFNSQNIDEIDKNVKEYMQKTTSAETKANTAILVGETAESLARKVKVLYEIVIVHSDETI